MIIGNNVQAVAGAYAVNQNRNMRRNEVQSAAAPRDEIVISQEGQSFSSMLKELKLEDTVRPDVVDSYKQAIQNGEYSVPAADIAGKMLAWL